MIKPEPGGRMKRWPLYAAITYVLVSVIGLTVVPEAPKVTDSGIKIVQYYRDHANAVRVFTWLWAISLIPLTLVLAQLRTRLVRAARDVMLFGAIGLIST